MVSGCMYVVGWLPSTALPCSPARPSIQRIEDVHPTPPHHHRNRGQRAIWGKTSFPLAHPFRLPLSQSRCHCMGRVIICECYHHRAPTPHQLLAVVDFAYYQLSISLPTSSTAHEQASNQHSAGAAPVCVFSEYNYSATATPILCASRLED